MRGILACALLVACGGSNKGPTAGGPIVTSLTPDAGLWGSEVTITGESFGGPGMGSRVSFPGSVGANGFVVDTWTDTQILGRVAFPATGAIVVTTRAGEAQAGAFTTTAPWQPSAPLDVTQPIAGLVLSTGDTVALYRDYELANQVTLAVFSGASAGVYQVAGVDSPMDGSSPVLARLVESDDHAPEVIATRSDGSVAAFQLQGSALVATATGLSGTIVAAARDATGLYAWIATANGLSRARPGSPWTIDRGPFATTYALLDGAAAADGTLWIAVSEPAMPNGAYIALQTLAPTATQLSQPERADPASHADRIARAHVILAGDGVRAVVLATADAGGTAMDLAPRLRSAAATWSDAPTMTGLVEYAFVGGALSAVVNDAQHAQTSLVPDVTMPAGAQLIPVWPMQSEGFVIDGTGKAHVLVTNATGGVTYALTPP
jgi:hypothetical protein